MKNICITSAIRTAVGSLGKSLKNISAEKLGSVVISNAVKNSKLSINDVDEVIWTGSDWWNRPKPSATSCY